MSLSQDSALPDWAYELGGDVHKLVLNDGVLDWWRKQVEEWSASSLHHIKGLEEWDHRHREHFTVTVPSDPTLTDKSRNDLRESGWHWVEGGPHFGLDQLPHGKDVAAVDAWVPRGLRECDRPDAEPPFPLPQRQLELPEKYAVLAAIHGRTQNSAGIDPHGEITCLADHGFSLAAVPYANLQCEIQSLNKHDEAVCRGYFGDVKKDLAENSQVIKANANEVTGLDGGAVQVVSLSTRTNYDRDHVWLKWKTEGLTDAKIRDKWKLLTDDERSALAPRTPDSLIGSKQNDADLVKKAVKRAAEELKKQGT